MRIAIVFALSMAAVVQALVGDWTSYTRLSGVRDMKEAKGFLFCATNGGVRKINPVTGAESIYSNREGLKDVGINALAVSPSGDVFATSELGFVYGYDQKADDWDILGTSYKGVGWRMNRRALLYRDGYLVLGSEKGLSFFNVGKKIAEANVTKMGAAAGLSVNSVLFVGDTLFVGTSRGIYRTVLRLERLVADPQFNISNPAIWSLIPGTDGVLYFTRQKILANPLNPSTDSGDSAKILLKDSDPKFAHGFLYYGPEGISSGYDGVDLAQLESRVTRFSDIQINGRFFSNPYRMNVIGHAQNHWYVSDGLNLFEAYPRQELAYRLVRNAMELPSQEILAVSASQNGVYAWAHPFIYKLKGKAWESVAVSSGFHSTAESKQLGLDAFSVNQNEGIYQGTWGGGFQIIQNGTETIFNTKNSCLKTADKRDPNYPVVYSQTEYKSKGIFLGSFIVEKIYRLAYYDYQAKTVKCLETNNLDRQPREIQVVGDSVLVVVTERSVEAFKIIDDGTDVRVAPVNLLSSLKSISEPMLRGEVDRFGNFWVTTEGSRLSYIPNVVFKSDSVQYFQDLEGFPGSSCKSLKADPQGHLWAGCTEGGLFEITPARDSLAHSFRSYGLNDGLVSEVIFQMDVNPDNGDVWVVTEKGLSRFESASRPTRPSLSGVKVFPNPFLAKHTAIAFDKLAPGSEVKVTTASGSVIFHRSLTSDQGDQIRWNGRNQAGERVREGVYFYVVRSPKETKNGKIIVAR